MKDIIYDGLVGFTFFAGLSYISDNFQNEDKYFKLVAFLWAAPFTYFYLLYITSKAGKKAVDGFNKHALLGTCVTAFLIVLNMFLQDKCSSNYSITLTFILTFLFVLSYYFLRLFEKI